MYKTFGVLAAVFALTACHGPDEGTGWEGETMGRADEINRFSIPVESSDYSTQVWTVRNAWEDRDTPEARAAGMAWGENSGLNWEEKYVKWVESMQKVPSNSYGDTFTVTTPYGKTLPTPKLECSEAPLFLRITFASWYGLPYFISGGGVFAGHFGVRTASGKHADTPDYKSAYRDYSNTSPADIAAGNWPKDQKLRSRGLSGGDDDVDYIFPGAHAGGYFDEPLLNKRVGYFKQSLEPR